MTKEATRDPATSTLEVFETADIAAMIDTLKASQMRLEAKGLKTQVSVHKGRKVTKIIPCLIKKSVQRLTITPMETDTDFTATAEYHYWSDKGPLARTAEFFWKKGRGIKSNVLKLREKDASVAEHILGNKGPRKDTELIPIAITALNKSSSFIIELS